MDIKLSKFFNANFIRMALLFTLLVISANALEEVIDDVFFDPIEGDYEFEQFDSKVSDFVRQIESDNVTAVMRDLTSLGSISVATIMALVAGLMLFIFRRYLNLLYLLIVCGATPLIVTTLKLFFGRERPPETNWLLDYMPGLSFPSGHSFTSAAIYLAIAYILTVEVKRWPFELLIYSVMLMVIFLVGVSRIYLGVHYATDVIAGISSGIIWVMLVTMAFEYYSKFHKAGKHN
ncbi:phosphatase PAP2 family protein [Aliiglaciecola litoralis]|uniref:undecaprenyl-diphosphate phosphatase n=1 Tax=Aliiglaciecola litoralis TaxID=582857 RepID=A0ABN1LEU2_9ALTE